MTNVDLLRDISAIYTPIEEAVPLLLKRNRQSELLSRIESDLNFPLQLKVLFSKPRIIMFRHIAAGSNEFVRVLSVAKKFNLELIVIEYLEDIFTPSLNRDKYTLAKIPIYNGSDINSNSIISNINVVDFAKMEGKPFSTVLTHKKEFLPNLHHDLIQEHFNFNTDKFTLDASAWLLSFKSPKEYYRQLFKLFIAHSIIAEVYYADGPEEYFSSEVILPALESIRVSYGIKPLIWNHIEGYESEQKSFWDCYPKHIGDLLRKKGYY